MRIALPVAVLLALSVAAGQTAAEYDDPQLLMRSGGGSAYQTPVGTSWSSKTPRLNDHGTVAMSINLVPPQFNAGVWQGDVSGGAIVDIADEDGALYTDVGLNLAGYTVWTRNESNQNGILRYDPDEDETVFLTNAPLGASGWSAVDINDSGEVGYRAQFGFSGRAWVSWHDGDAEVHLAENGVDSNSPYAFLFTPSLNNQREIAGKAAINTTTTNQIVIADATGNVQVLVEDNDLDPDSPFSNFDNSVGFNDQGQVAFIATLAAGGRGVFVVDSDGWTQYALAGQDGLGSIEFFGPQLNDNGVVAFRGENSEGDRAIWVADGDSVVAVATHGDIVDTDLGPSRLQSPDGVGGPNFGGAPALNNQDQVAFVSLLTDPDDSSVSRGRGIFLVSRSDAGLAMTLLKSADPETYSETGQLIDYSYEIENTGQATIEGPITVDDDHETVSCPPDDLEVGQSMTCTAQRTIGQADLDAGSITNQAVAIADLVQSNSDTATITAVQSPLLTIDKVLSDAPDPIEAGSVLTYTVTATNGGNITLDNVVVADTLLDPDSQACAQLAPSDSCILTGTYEVSQDDVDAGEVVNTATADADQAEPVQADLTTPIEQHLALALVKSADPMVFDTVDQVIDYSYQVTNTGNTTLPGPVAVADDQESVTCPVGDLAPGDTVTCHAQRVISQDDIDAGQVTNIATASAGDASSAPASVTIRTPPIFHDRFEAEF